MANTNRPFVVIESPFRGDVELHCQYADALMLDSLNRGEAPFLGHLLYTRVWNDDDPVLRDMGIEAHCSVILRADFVVVGSDYPISSGMMDAIELARSRLIPVKERRLGDDWRSKYQVTRTPGFR